MSSPKQPPMVPIKSGISRGELARLFVLFGTLYFVQGVIEPTFNLPSQPLVKQLDDFGYSTGEVGRFLAIIGIAWSIKPLFGLISDFLPIGGRRRWPYLVFSTALAATSFLILARWWSPRIAGGEISEWGLWLLARNSLSTAGWLMIAVGIGIAMSDVVIDALAVEEGQPRGITGQIQAVQWGAMSVATLITGVLGGYIAQAGYIREMFLGCGLLGLASLLTVLFLVREPRRPARQRGELLRDFWAAIAELIEGRRLAVVLTAGAFLFLWNFNPFYSNVLQTYMTKELHFSELFYGSMQSVQGAAQIVASIAYFWYCRRVPLGWLVHGSIVSGIAATLVYWLMFDFWSAVLASLVYGFAYQTATLIQLDLCARICPTSSAGTMFALLMAISNTGNNFGIHYGGQWYDQLTQRLHDPHRAFDLLVLIGGAFTAGCWLLVPVMKWSGVQWTEKQM